MPAFDGSAGKSLLRFITCGSVDDGKSTLIGRLLYDSDLLLEDQLAALAADSRKSGTQGGELDFALLVDGLSAEREQGITIDVAYRFFATGKRKFIVADTPGHEQYTRNMVTGASTAELAVILADARKGVLAQTRRHSYLVHLLGIRRLVLAVNKMDLVGNDRCEFERIVADYRSFADEAGIADFTAIPVCALDGGNVGQRSGWMPWYEGPTLLEHLEAVPAESGAAEGEPFRMAVQWVNRPNPDFRGYAGQIASGRVRVGDRIAVLPAGRLATVSRIVTFDGDLDEAAAGKSVTLVFAEAIDCSRGDVVVSEDAPTAAVDRVEATLIWMSEEAMVPNRPYWLKIGTRTVSAYVRGNGATVDLGTMQRREGIGLGLNDIGRVEIELDRQIPVVRYSENRQLGGFILIDKMSNATAAAGLIEG
jgi:bifunctional enzyme CysN/CysC